MERMHWLNQLNNKTIEKIFLVDFNNERHEDIYLPWLYFITFSDLNKFLEIEGDIGGVHIKINLYDISELDQKLSDNNFPNEQNLWRIYEVGHDELPGKLLKQKINFIEFGIDKDEYEINNKKFQGRKDVFHYIQFKCESISLTIFEGSATGLDVSAEPNVKLNFEETFDKYSTK